MTGLCICQKMELKQNILTDGSHSKGMKNTHWHRCVHTHKKWFSLSPQCISGHEAPNRYLTKPFFLNHIVSMEEKPAGNRARNGETYSKTTNETATSCTTFCVQHNGLLAL
ncbi:hypothetical protein AMECASPLE_038361 [Ameca splendens]|uniref:Uncharacterized protein n=1 Tax=Ameca splendens TaxID=208324 RepID=A0ABV1AEJ9_9TELE